MCQGFSYFFSVLKKLELVFSSIRVKAKSIGLIDNLLFKKKKDLCVFHPLKTKYQYVTMLWYIVIAVYKKHTLCT